LKQIGTIPPPADPVASVNDSLLVQARLLSKTVTAIFDERLRPYGASSAQFALLALIGKTEPITRARIARLQHLDKSTLTRNLRAILSEGWAVEVPENANGRSRPIALSPTGKALLLNAQSAWLAAQEQATALLGDDAATAIVNCAERIIQHLFTT
jgi:DNA-binding MarR family transcriptional regulator